MSIDVVAQRGNDEPEGTCMSWQRGISMIELIMFIVIISVVETDIRIISDPISLPGMLQ